MRHSPHLLIIRFSALGDVAMTIPVIRQLASEYPQLQITLLSQAFAGALLVDMPANVHFMAADLKKEHHGIKGLNNLFRRLHAKHFTHVADLHDVLRTKYLRFRFLINRYPVCHIDKHRRERRQLVRHRGDTLPVLPTQFQNYADVFRRLGYPIQSPPQSPEGEVQAVKASPRGGLEGASIVGIAPFAAHKGKIYPLEKMERVVEMLAQDDEIDRICFHCGKGEESRVVDEWCRKWDKCTNASAALGSLEKELQAISTYSAMLTMDSANAHLAAIVGTPTVTIWGATHPNAGFAAWNAPDDSHIQVDLPCRPCSIYGKRPCQRGDYACLYGINEQQVVDKIIRTVRSHR